MIAIAVFQLPSELVAEILSHFGDPHRNVLFSRGQCNEAFVEDVERLTVLRKLTMTCWRLRNALFPLLWEYVEGCNIYESDTDPPRLKNGLYSQSAYIVRNPTVGAYVQYVHPWVHSNSIHEVPPFAGRFRPTWTPKTTQVIR